MMLQGQIIGVPFTLIITGDTVNVGVTIVGVGVFVLVVVGDAVIVRVGVRVGVGTITVLVGVLVLVVTWGVAVTPIILLDIVKVEGTVYGEPVDEEIRLLLIVELRCAPGVTLIPNSQEPIKLLPSTTVFFSPEHELYE